MKITYEFDSNAMKNFDPTVQYGQNPKGDFCMFYEIMSSINLISVGVEKGISSKELQQICKYMACVVSFENNDGSVDFIQAKKDLDIDLLKDKYLK